MPLSALFPETLFRLVGVHVIGIVEEAAPDRIDDPPGWRRLGRDRACKLDRIAVANKAAKIDDMIGCCDDLDRGYPRINSSLGQSLRDVLLHGQVRGGAGLLRSHRSGTRQKHEGTRDDQISCLAHQVIIAKAQGRNKWV